ncbi:MAG: AMP-binding protein [Acidobacteria bacterium]|nr:AMP-binding protein [Acidobacteriota bacterium]
MAASRQPRNSLLSFLEDYASAGNRPCLIFDDGFRLRRYSYRQITQAVEDFTGRLSEAGISPGDKVLFWCENRPEWIVAFWGCLRLHAVVVPIDYRSSIDFVRRVHQMVCARLIFYGEETSNPQLNIHAWKLSFEELNLRRAGRLTVPMEPQAETIAEIVFTSGATGVPRGVVITHGNILANVVPIEKELGKYRGYVRVVGLHFLNSLPLSHMYGQVLSIFVPQLLREVVALQSSYNPRDIISLIRRERISVLVSVPKLLDLLSDYLKKEYPDLPLESAGRLPLWKRWWKFRRVHWRFGLKFWAFIVGSAPLSPRLEGFWSRLGFLVIQGYGLTETAPIVTLNHPFGAKRGSLGKPLEGLQIKLAPDGEILIRGANVTPGYFNAPEENAEAFKDGWFHTGDIGAFDESGRLYFRGRKKEMIVTPEGLNVFPEDVEKILNTLEPVVESAVVGVAEDGEERVHGVVVLRADADLLELQRKANEQLETHQRIRSISLWPSSELPRTEGTGKLKRGEVREWLLGKTQRKAPADRLTRLIAGISGREQAELDESKRLAEDLGLGSLEKLELLVELEKQLNVSLDDQLFTEARDLRGLKQLIARAAASEPPLHFPTWALSRWASVVRAVTTVLVIIPLTRFFLWLRIEGKEQLPNNTPVLFAANHQSHLDVPAIKAALPWKRRFRVAPAMSLEFFAAHFWPEKYSMTERFRCHLEYWAACLFFEGFPLPQRQLGARQTLRFMGELVEKGRSIVVFPEGERSPGGSIGAFRPGIGLMASLLRLPVVPVRIEGLEHVLPVGAHFPRPGKVRIAFGRPLWHQGEDYSEFARRVENAVRGL